MKIKIKHNKKKKIYNDKGDKNKLPDFLNEKIKTNTLIK